MVCRDASVGQIDDGKNYCDVAVSFPNDFVDIIKENQHFFKPTNGREAIFTGISGETYRFVGLKGLVDLAFGQKDKVGIMDIVFDLLQDEGCFTRQDAAVHVMGWTLCWWVGC